MLMFLFRIVAIATILYLIYQAVIGGYYQIQSFYWWMDPYPF